MGEKVKKLPQLLKSPILIIKANENTKDSTFIVVTNENDKNGNRIIAVVKPYGKGNYYNVEITSNVLLSAYGKHNITNFVNKAFKENRILYSINSNSQQKNTTGVQFSNNIMSADYTNNLAHFKQIVNSNSMQENEKHSLDLEENVSKKEEAEGKYSYNALISKPDMLLTNVDTVGKYKPTSADRKNAVDIALSNAKNIGRLTTDGAISIFVKDIKGEILLSKKRSFARYR